MKEGLTTSSPVQKARPEPHNRTARTDRSSRSFEAVLAIASNIGISKLFNLDGRESSTLAMPSLIYDNSMRWSSEVENETNCIPFLPTNTSFFVSEGHFLIECDCLNCWQMARIASSLIFSISNLWADSTSNIIFFMKNDGSPRRCERIPGSDTVHSPVL